MRKTDLLNFIQQGNTKNINNGEFIKGKLVGYRYYGFVCSEVEHNNLPNYIKRLQKLDESDTWVAMRIMAIGNTSELKNKRGECYFAYGTILALVGRNVVLNDWYMVDGTARTVLYDGTGSCCYISSMKKDNGVWKVTPFPFEDINLDEIPKDMYNCIMASVENNVFIQPAKPESYIEVVPYDTQENKRNIAVTDISEPSKYGVVLEGKQQSKPVQQRQQAPQAPQQAPQQIPQVRLQRQQAEPTKKVNSNVTDRQINAYIDKIQKTEKPSELIAWRQVKNRNRVKVKPTSRDSCADVTNKARILTELCDLSNKVRTGTLKDVKDKYEFSADVMQDTDITKAKQIFIELLQSVENNMTRKPQGVGLSGRVLLAEYIKKNEYSTREYKGLSLGDSILNMGFSTVLDYMRYRTGVSDYKINIPFTEDYIIEFVDDIFNMSYEIVYARFMAILLGLRYKELSELATECISSGVSFIEISRTNPYLFILIDADINLNTIEIMANAFGVQNEESSWKLACILNEAIKNFNGCTAFDIYKIYKEQLHYTIGKNNLKRLRENGNLLTQEIKANIKCYLEPQLNESLWAYDGQGFDENGRRNLPKEKLQQAIIAYVDCGLGVVFNGILYNTQVLNKDIYMYNKLINMAKDEIEDIDNDLIEISIKEYERKKSNEFNCDYKLEEEQKNAVRLVSKRICCVTGPAGSGKTTTVDAMIYAIRQQKNGRRLKIKYAAPTGKAAKRLQEVVGEKVSTMHLMFKIFDNNVSELSNIDEDDITKCNGDIFIFDEQAMVDSNLMYKVITRIPESARIMFIGDVEQLVAIGSGTPFSDFLRILPSVVLTVSKRSSESSDITKNAKNIIDNSNRENFIEMYNGKDFKMHDCADEDIDMLAIELCKAYMGKPSLYSDYVIPELSNLEPDDIQVISPVVKSKYTWGCDKMNVMLQDVFNPQKQVFNASVTFSQFGVLKTFRVGSRVINTVNDYNMTHYSSVQGGRFQMGSTKGIMNGDVGTIWGIYDGDKCVEIEPIDGTDDDEKLTTIDSKLKPGYIIIAVRFYSPEEEDYYYILYSGRKDSVRSTLYNIVISYTDMDNIQLAYCLTTHKMQGSQAKLVIFCCGTGYGLLGTFLNRNLLYTSITRATNGVHIIGNIPILEKCRLYDSSFARQTAMEELAIEV